MIIKNGLVFCDNGEFQERDIKANNGVIAEIGESLNKNGCEAIDANECYVIPGLVDIHTHGAMGADFSDGTPEAVNTIAGFLLKNGITSFLGTTMTLPEKQLLDICETAQPVVDKNIPGQAVLRSIHLEGPFIGFEKRGAQNAEYITEPDFPLFMRLYEASGKAVKIIVTAPEAEGSPEFIHAAAQVCTVSLAHSSSDYQTAKKAFEAGASHVTHLFNGMNPLNHREPGIAGAAFDSGVYVELIADGIHIHQSVVRAVFKLFGDDRVCLISDSMRACGLADGQYDLGGQTVTVNGRTATIGSGSLAGSVTTLADCMRRSVEFGVTLSGAIKASTINPARSAGIEKAIGSLTAGKQADILVLDRTLTLKHIILGGIIIM